MTCHKMFERWHRHRCNVISISRDQVNDIKWEDLDTSLVNTNDNMERDRASDPAEYQRRVRSMNVASNNDATSHRIFERAE